MAVRRILAIDPGTVKCGIAVIAEGQRIPLYLRVVHRDEIEYIVRDIFPLFMPDHVLIGRGTSGQDLFEALGRRGLKSELVDEHGTTLAARERYFSANPPRGWTRFLPPGLRLPPRPIDDWAAVVIAEQYLARLNRSR
jgi:RNase H-fold protein (predicted Holliday junction resolvase)